VEPEAAMIAIAVIGAVVVLGLVLAGWRDFRARRRGRRFSLTSTEALNNRIDADVRGNVSFPAGQSWTDRRPRR
jgi:hypothetical protein